MSNHNYSQYSNNKKKKNYNKPKVEETVEQFAPVIEEIVPEVITSIAAPDVPIEVEMSTAIYTGCPVGEPGPEGRLGGTIANCSKLNVRSKPSTEAEVLTVLEAKSEVLIDPARSTTEWLKITTASGVDGFCMRKFVSVKK